MADRPGLMAGPSVTLLERSAGRLSLSLFGGPSEPGGRTMMYDAIHFKGIEYKEQKYEIHKIRKFRP